MSKDSHPLVPESEIVSELVEVELPLPVVTLNEELKAEPISFLALPALLLCQFVYVLSLLL